MSFDSGELVKLINSTLYWIIAHWCRTQKPWIDQKHQTIRNRKREKQSKSKGKSHFGTETKKKKKQRKIYPHRLKPKLIFTLWKTFFFFFFIHWTKKKFSLIDSDFTLFQIYMEYHPPNDLDIPAATQSNCTVDVLLCRPHQLSIPWPQEYLEILHPSRY